jgi:biotin operon repressor
MNTKFSDFNILTMLSQHLKLSSTDEAMRAMGAVRYFLKSLDQQGYLILPQATAAYVGVNKGETKARSKPAANKHRSTRTSHKATPEMDASKLFNLLLDRPHTISQLTKDLNRSTASVEAMVAELRSSGHTVVEERVPARKGPFIKRVYSLRGPVKLSLPTQSNERVTPLP